MSSIVSPIPKAKSSEPALPLPVRRWLTNDEAAAYLGSDVSTFRRYVKVHELRPSRFSPGSPRWDVNDLDALMIRLKEVDS